MIDTTYDPEADAVHIRMRRGKIMNPRSRPPITNVDADGQNGSVVRVAAFCNSTHPMFNFTSHFD